MSRAWRRAEAAAERRDHRRRRGLSPTCPQCRSVQVIAIPVELGRAGPGFYGQKLEGCRRCGAVWEAVPHELIWDPSTPYCSFSEPCDNCAFRPGSPEQADTEEWRATIAALKAGGSFHCHKGVPIDPGHEHGFRYPVEEDGSPDQSRMRFCRGYLNALGRWWKRHADDTPHIEEGDAP